MAALDFAGKPRFKLALHAPLALASPTLRSAAPWPPAPSLRNRLAAQSALSDRVALPREFVLVDSHCAAPSGHTLVDEPELPAAKPTVATGGRLAWIRAG